MAWTLSHSLMHGGDLILALFCVKLLHTQRFVYGWFPFFPFREVCVIAVRRMLPKQRHVGKLLLSITTTQGNRACILPLFMTPDTHLNPITQLPAVPSPLDLTHYLSLSSSPLVSISLDPLLPLSCLLPYPSFIPWHLPHFSPPLLSITRMRHNWNHDIEMYHKSNLIIYNVTVTLFAYSLNSCLATKCSQTERCRFVHCQAIIIWIYRFVISMQVSQHFNGL